MAIKRKFDIHSIDQIVWIDNLALKRKLLPSRLISWRNVLLYSKNDNGTILPISFLFCRSPLSIFHQILGTTLGYDYMELFLLVETV